MGPFEKIAPVSGGERQSREEERPRHEELQRCSPRLTPNYRRTCGCRVVFDASASRRRYLGAKQKRCCGCRVSKRQEFPRGLVARRHWMNPLHFASSPTGTFFKRWRVTSIYLSVSIALWDLFIFSARDNSHALDATFSISLGECLPKLLYIVHTFYTRNLITPIKRWKAK